MLVSNALPAVLQFNTHVSRSRAYERWYKRYNLPWPGRYWGQGKWKYACSVSLWARPKLL